MAKNLIAIDEWLGHHGETIDPEKVAFNTKPRKGDSCSGCLFDSQRAEVCHAAARKAGRLGMKDCDEGVVYKLIPVDPRQLLIPGTDT